MLQWFNKTGDDSSATADSLTQENPLRDDDYEFLFNQLLDGVAHGWHLGRIVKFFELLEPRGSITGWINWFEQFETRVVYSNDPAKRRIGAIMMRLGELIQSREELEKIAVISHRIGKKLYVGNVAELIWEYDGVDTVIAEDRGITENPGVADEEPAAEPTVIADDIDDILETVIESGSELPEQLEQPERQPEQQLEEQAEPENHNLLSQEILEPMPSVVDETERAAIEETTAVETDDLDEIVSRAFEAFSQSENLAESLELEPGVPEQSKVSNSIVESESVTDSDRNLAETAALSTEELINQAFEAGINELNSANSDKSSAEEVAESIDLAFAENLENQKTAAESVSEVNLESVNSEPLEKEESTPQHGSLQDEQTAEAEARLDSVDESIMPNSLLDAASTSESDMAESDATPEELAASVRESVTQPVESSDELTSIQDMPSNPPPEDLGARPLAEESEIPEELEPSSAESLTELSEQLLTLQNDILEDEAAEISLAPSETVNAPFAVASFLEAAKTLAPEHQNQSQTNLTWEEFIVALEQNEVLAQQVAQYLELDSNNPQDIIQAAVDRFSNKQQTQLKPATIELVESWFHLGLKQASAEDFQGAIASWDKALKLNPNLSEAWHNRGSALGRLGNYEAAVYSFNKAIDLAPERYQAWNDRAHALYQLQKWQEAVESWEKAISITPDNYQFWYNRGCALEQLDNIVESIVSYEKALEIKPDFQSARKRYISLIKESSSTGSN